MNRSGPITGITREKTVPNAHPRVAAWVEAQPNEAAPTPTSYFPSLGNIGRSEAPALVMAGDPALPVSPVVQALVAAGRRVYVLVPPGWSDESLDPRRIQPTQALFRRVDLGTLAALHLGETDCRVMVGDHTELLLDPDQARDFRYLFLRLFWHEAKEESWLTDKGLQWTPVRERPYDIPLLPPQAWVRREPALRLPARRVRWIHLHETPAALPAHAPRQLSLPAGGAHHSVLNEWVSAGVPITAANQAWPDLVLDEDSGEILFPGAETNRIRLRLKPAQATTLQTRFAAAVRWRFTPDVSLAELHQAGTRLWPADGPKPVRIETRHEMAIPQPIIAGKIQSLDTTEPTLPSPGRWSLETRYTWQVLPPTLPSGAKLDALYEEWKRFDEAWKTTLEKIRTRLDSCGSALKALAKESDSVELGLPGYQNQFAQLERTLVTQGQMEPSTCELHAVQEAVSQLTKSIAEMAELDANLDIAGQKAAWKQQVAVARRKYAEADSKLEEAKKQQSSLSRTMATEENAQKADSKNKDLAASIAKAKSDLTRVSKEINKAQAERDDAQKVMDTPFKPKTDAVPPPGNTKAQRFVPDTDSGPVRSGAALPRHPAEPLPCVGQLYVAQGRRHLVIARWEDLESGLRTAAKYQATLVATST